MTREELEDLLDEIDPEDIREAIKILEERYDSWQDWLSMPSL